MRVFIWRCSAKHTSLFVLLLCSSSFLVIYYQSSFLNRWIYRRNPVDPNLFPSSTNTGDRDKSSSAHLIAKLHGMFRDLPPPSYSKSNLPDSIKTTTTADNSLQDTGLLLIVAYLRSGSTLMGSLFNQSPENFYVFEPLHMMSVQYSTGQNFSYLNGTQRKYRRKQMPDSVARDALKDWLSCRFEHIDLNSLMDTFHDRYSDSLKTFRSCTFNERKKNYLAKAYRIKHPCISAVKKRCEDARIRVFKTIRLRMSQVEELMDAFPKMKVIHLVRDPRGMINSQLKTKLVKKSGKPLQTIVSKYCRNIEDDVRLTQYLSRNKQGRIRLVKYEDLAEYPFQIVTALYRFAKLNLTEEVIKHVNKSTSMNLRDDCAYCTTRRNSTKTAYQWHEEISDSVLALVDSLCASVYRLLGYERFKPVRKLKYLDSSSLYAGAKVKRPAQSGGKIRKGIVPVKNVPVQ